MEPEEEREGSDTRAAAGCRNGVSRGKARGHSVLDGRKGLSPVWPPAYEELHAVEFCVKEIGGTMGNLSKMATQPAHKTGVNVTGATADGFSRLVFFLPKLIPSQHGSRFTCVFVSGIICLRNLWALGKQKLDDFINIWLHPHYMLGSLLLITFYGCIKISLSEGSWTDQKKSMPSYVSISLFPLRKCYSVAQA